MLKHFLFIVSFLFAEQAMAGSPCIFGGSNFVECFPTAGINLTNQRALRLGEAIGNGTNYVQLKADANLPADYTFNFPTDIPGILGHINLIESFDPLNVSSTRNSFQTNLVPTADYPTTDFNEFKVTLDDSTDFEINSYTVFSGESNSTGSVDRGTITGLSLNNVFGHGVDPTTLTMYRGVQQGLTLSANATATNVQSVVTGINAPAGSTIGSYQGFSDGSAIDEGTSYVGLDLNPNLNHLTDVYAGINLNGTITDTDNGFNGVRIGPNITNSDAQVNSFGVFANMGTINGANVLEDGSSVTTQTGNYNGVNIHPNITTSSGYRGIANNPTFGTVTTAINGFEENTNVTTTAIDYNGMSIQPTFVELTSNFNGLNINPTVVGDGSGNARGIFVDTQNITNFGTGNVKAIQSNGDVEVNGKLNAGTNTVIANNGGNPQPTHTINTGFTLAPATTVTSGDAFGFGPIMNVQIGAGSTVSSGGFGLGLASLGMVNLLDMGAGSTLDYTTGSFVAMVLSSGSGHIDNITNYRAVAVNSGATTTVDNVYGFKNDLLAGPLSTDSWGFYDSGAEYNWFKNSLQIGGSAGSTDRAANDSVGLGILGRALYPVPMTTTARDALTPLTGMLINNSTTGDFERYDGAVWTAVGGGTLQDAYDAGNAITTTGTSIVFNGPDNLIIGLDGGISVSNSSAIDGIAINKTTAGTAYGLNSDVSTASGSSSIRAAQQGAGDALLTFTATGRHWVMENADNDTISISPPATGLTNYDLTLPPDVGSNFFALTTDGAGLLNWTNPLTLGNPINGGSAGGVFFADPSNNLGQDGGSFVWDAVTASLGIGTNTPASKLHVDADGLGADALILDPDSAQAALTFQMDGGDIRIMESGSVTSYDLYLPSQVATLNGSPLVSDNTGGLSWGNIVNLDDGAGNTASLNDPANSAAGLALNVAQASAIGVYVVMTDTGGSTSAIQAQSDADAGDIFFAYSNSAMTAPRHMVFRNVENDDIGFKMPVTGVTSYNMTVPAVQGANNSAMVNNGSGGLEWKTVANTWQTATNTCTTASTCTATCASATRAIGGSCRNSAAIALQQSYASASSPGAWTCDYATALGNITVDVTCATF